MINIARKMMMQLTCVHFVDVYEFEFAEIEKYLSRC